MITREMIENGFKTGRISIEEEYGGCMGICCKIGDMAFYFVGSEDSNLTKEEYWNSYTLDMTINMIYDTLKNEKSAEENGLDEWELGYYESILNDNEKFNHQEQDNENYFEEINDYLDNSMEI